MVPGWVKRNGEFLRKRKKKGERWEMKEKFKNGVPLASKQHTLVANISSCVCTQSAFKAANVSY